MPIESNHSTEPVTLQPTSETAEKPSFHALAQHGEDAQRAYDGLSDLPAAYRHEFLKALDDNPSANVDDLASFVRTKARVRELSESADAEGGASTSGAADAPAVEAKPQEDTAADAAGTELEEAQARIVALEAELRDVSKREDERETSAQQAAETARQRLDALEKELDGLRGERESLRQQVSLAQAAAQAESRAFKREITVNLIAALIFVVALAVFVSYFTGWPESLWRGLRAAS